MDLRANVLRQLKNRRDGFSLDQAFYTDREYFKLDMETIYYRDWLFIGHDCEVPRAGNYLTVQIGDYPVVIVRGRDSVIRDGVFGLSPISGDDVGRCCASS